MSAVDNEYPDWVTNQFKQYRQKLGLPCDNIIVSYFQRLPFEQQLGHNSHLNTLVVLQGLAGLAYE